MKFNKVIVNNVRNIKEMVFFPSAKFNFIYGENGSGKTSLLESLYYFGHVRSFRSHLVDRIIKQDQEVMTLFSELIAADESRINIGIQRHTNKDCKIHIQQQTAKTTAELAVLLPILLINPDSFTLLDGGPKPRRALLDWGVFHVEHRYQTLWQRFQRCLKQRNMALRQHLPVDQITIWDAELCSMSIEIDEYRSQYCEKLYLKFSEIINKLFPDNDFKCSYQRGWPKDHKLSDLMREHLQQDLERGYSFYGPQRADLLFKVDAVPLQDFLSRGQQKVIVCALRIAQAQILFEQTQKESIFLIDDLPAELGMEYRTYLIDALHALNAQVYLTAIEKESLLPVLINKPGKMFHVEHGHLTEVWQYSS